MLPCCNRLSAARERPLPFPLPHLPSWDTKRTTLLLTQRNPEARNRSWLSIKTLNLIMGPLKKKGRKEGERGMFVGGSLSEQGSRHRLVFVCAIAPVCFSFSRMNKEGLYGVNSALVLYNSSFPLLRQRWSHSVIHVDANTHTHTHEK